MEIVPGEDWMNGTTIWRVSYEYADANGGGWAIDYFKTPNRYTPPTGSQIRDSLDGSEMMVCGIEKIETFWTHTPNDTYPSETPEDARHQHLYDAFNDEPPYRPLTS